MRNSVPFFLKKYVRVLKQNKIGTNTQSFTDSTN